MHNKKTSVLKRIALSVISIYGIAISFRVTHAKQQQPIQLISHVQCAEETVLYDLFVDYDSEKKTMSVKSSVEQDNPFELSFTRVINMMMWCSADYRTDNGIKALESLTGDGSGYIDFDAAVYFSECEPITQGLIKEVHFYDQDELDIFFEVENGLLYKVSAISEWDGQKKEYNLKYTYDDAKKLQLIEQSNTGFFFEGQSVRLYYDKDNRLSRKEYTGERYWESADVCYSYIETDPSFYTMTVYQKDESHEEISYGTVFFEEEGLIIDTYMGHFNGEGAHYEYRFDDKGNLKAEVESDSEKTFLTVEFQEI